MVREEDHRPEVLQALVEDLAGGANHHVVPDDVLPQPAASAGPARVHHNVVSRVNSVLVGFSNFFRRHFQHSHYYLRTIQGL